MENILWIVIGVLVGGIIAYLFLNKKKETSKDTSDTGLQLILTQLNELSRTVDGKIGESNKQMNELIEINKILNAPPQKYREKKASCRSSNILKRFFRKILFPKIRNLLLTFLPEK